MMRLARKMSLTAAAMAIFASGAVAQDYPEEAVTVIVPYAAGGSVDVLTRLVADHMSKTLGQPVILENAPGAGGSVGSSRAADSEVDGYTLVSGSSGSHAVAYSFYDDLRYDADSFEQVGLIALIPSLIAVRKDLEVEGLQDLIDLAKEKPGELTFGHPGVGSHVHLACELLRQSTGIDVTLVPYQGAAHVTRDLMAGVLDAACDATPTSTAPHLAGSFRAVAIMNDERADSLPEVPTTAEEGHEAVQAPTWIALFAPAGTSEEIVGELEDALSLALDDETIQARFAELGVAVPREDQRGSDYLDAFVESEIAKWSQVAENADLGPAE